MNEIVRWGNIFGGGLIGLPRAARAGKFVQVPANFFRSAGKLSVVPANFLRSAGKNVQVPANIWHKIGRQKGDFAGKIAHAPAECSK